MTNTCNLTLEECRLIINAIITVDSFMPYLHNHGMRPFKDMPKEKYKKQVAAFNKIRQFINDNSDDNLPIKNV